MPGLRKRFGLALGLATTCLLIFCAAQVVNYHREPWLGIEPGYAPHNFAFNVAFYIPSVFLSSCLAFISIIVYFLSLDTLRRNEERPRLRERAAILPIAPVLMFDALLAALLFRMIVS